MSDPTPHSTKIALSDRWTAWARVSSVVGPMILVPIAGFVAFTTWQSSVAIGSHTEDLANIKISVASIDTRGQADHDRIITVAAAFDALVIRVNDIKESLGKAWERIGAKRAGPDEAAP